MKFIKFGNFKFIKKILPQKIPENRKGDELITNKYCTTLALIFTVTLLTRNQKIFDFHRDGNNLGTN